MIITAALIIASGLGNFEVSAIQWFLGVFFDMISISTLAGD